MAKKAAHNRTHGLTFVPEFAAWRAMVARCTDPSHQHFKDYGARGITVCSEWATSYERFIRDLGPCPEGMQLGRRDMRKGYTRANTKWMTRSEAMRASSRSRKLEYGGAILSLVEWSEQVKVPVETIRRRLRDGWSPAQALGFTQRKAEPSCSLDDTKCFEPLRDD